MTREEIAQIVKSTAAEVGFDLCGITKAEVVPEAQARFVDWIKKGYHADMKYLENIERRTNPLEVMNKAKSLIMLAVNYYSQEKEEEESMKVARYARGRDYHKYIGNLLKQFTRKLKEQFPEEEFRFYVDYGPFLERTYAELAGIGFIGKNGNIITDKFGSWVLLAEVITSLEMEYDTPSVRKCGTCTKCLTSCPTDAFVSEGVLDAKRCISYYTIESKADTIPEDIKEKMKGWAFGCDICQEVCPFNNRLRNKETEHSDLKPRYASLHEKMDALESDENFLETFQGTPLMRAKRKGIKRNIT
ncbi:MAG: tRNA epoxyqueuosine(34) reductase QueG [Candidatus Gracilibacteria bacterium]